MRIKRWFRKLTAVQAEMAMNALPKTEVVTLLQSAGGRIIDTQAYRAAGDLESWSYLLTKAPCDPS